MPEESSKSGAVVLTLLTEEQIRAIVTEAVRDALALRVPEGFLDTDQASAYLGTTASSLRTLVSRGKIVPDHRGSRGGGMKGNRFSRATLDAFCKRQKGER